MYINADSNDTTSLDTVALAMGDKSSDELANGVVVQQTTDGAPTSQRIGANYTSSSSQLSGDASNAGETQKSANAAANAVVEHLQLDADLAASRVQYHKLLATPLIGEHRHRALLHSSKIDVAFDFSLRLIGWMCHREYDLKWHGKKLKFF